MRAFVNGIFVNTCDCTSCHVSLKLALAAHEIGDLVLACVALDNVSYTLDGRTFVANVACDLATPDEGYTQTWSREQPDNLEVN